MTIVYACLTHLDFVCVSFSDKITGKQPENIQQHEYRIVHAEQKQQIRKLSVSKQ